MGMALGAAAWGEAESEKISKDFNQVGYIVDVRALFATAAGETGADSMMVVQDTVAARAFVTGEDRVFAFLETPENKKFLAQIEPGAAVRIAGRLLTSGKLLQVDEWKSSETGPVVQFEELRKARGTEVGLTGVNKCQCGLEVGNLQHSCALGHLHHLEAEDGQLYHYLQSAVGQGLFLGRGSHFKKVEVKARLLPGNFLAVEQAQIVP